MRTIRLMIVGLFLLPHSGVTKADDDLGADELKALTETQSLLADPKQREKAREDAQREAGSQAHQAGNADCNPQGVGSQVTHSPLAPREPVSLTEPWVATSGGYPVRSCDEWCRKSCTYPR